MNFTLRSGNLIPMIGFGPGIMMFPSRQSLPNWILRSIPYRAYNKYIQPTKTKKQFVKAIISAFENGFRLLDYSNAYGNLDLVGKAIADKRVRREDIFITVRVSNKAQVKEEVREEVLGALKKLNIDYADLLQFHWPVTDCYVDTWREMIKLQTDGKVRILGVANCHRHHLEMLDKETGILPEVNQVEVHPLFTQKPLLEYCKERKIQAEAYTPIARYDDRLVRLPLLKELEKKYNKSFIQIILRWHIQNGVIPVVRALNPVHQKSNLDIFNFEIDDEDMTNIDSININSRLRYDPDNCDFTIL